MVDRSARHIVVLLLLLVAALPATGIPSPMLADSASGFLGTPAVNPTTNRIYVPLIAEDGTHSNIIVIDGASNTVIATLSLPNAGLVLVNPNTNRIYVGDKVIDGATNTVVASIPTAAAAVNPTTNRIYAAGNTSNTLTVIDGISNSAIAIIPVPVPSPSPTPGASPTPSPAPHDARYFSPTGFRIDNDVFWDYFNKRGGIRTFGYPVSRTFTFLGFTTQFFQREIMQLGPDGAARTLNILDPDLMPYTTINGATFPGVDPSTTAQAPIPGTPGYDTAVQSFVRDHAPDQFQGMNTSYYQTFANTVKLGDAFPGGDGDPNLLPGLNLEVWGVPTSNPAPDPRNGNFIYLRFQRGVMHFDATNNITQGLLLADYLKSILTGQNLPPDLDAQAKSSRFYKQYNPGKPLWIDRPNDLPATDLTNAFQTE